MFSLLRSTHAILLLSFFLHPVIGTASSTNKLNFPYTKVATSLPPEIEKNLSRIINYRFGTLPQSNMLTTEVRSYVEPGKIYRFNTGKLDHVTELTNPAFLPKQATIPKHLEFQGKWTSNHSSARKEANVLGIFGTLYIRLSSLTVNKDFPTPENLAYYGAILLESGQEIMINAPFPLPVNVVKFDENYEEGYLKLPSHGGGYYLEKHDTPHLWSHLDKEGKGVVLLGKEARPGIYHLTAFQIPFGKAIYAPGGVIHCDGLLIGNILAIYTITPDYSSVILKSPGGQITDLKLL